MESRISNTLGSLGENMRKMSNASNSRLAEKLLNSTDTYGNFIMWMPEPSLPSRYSGSIEMPSREIQLALIDQYFNERHESIGMLIKYDFYEQLETKGLLITPLLLNTIYAHAARFVSIPGCPKTEVFYHRARKLVDDFMDVPRVSTVAALCLLSLYEASPEIYRPGSYHCRQWQYSGMACRMALELGLYDDSNVHSSLNLVEIESRRRIFWACYDLDKFQSGGWERPWMISQTFIRTRYPSILPKESEDDARIIDVFNTKINFVNIVEENLILMTASQAFLGGNCGKDTFLGIHKDKMLESINENHQKHQQWLQALSHHMQWTPISPCSVKDILDLPAPRAMVGHLHLYFNTLCLGLIDRLPTTSVVRFQSRVTATCMTQLAYHLCQQPSYIIKFDFIVHALINAIKVHIRYLDDEDTSLAQQAWLLFDRSIWCMQLAIRYVVIPNCTKFLQQVQNIYGLHIENGQEINSAELPTQNIRNSNRSDSPSFNSLRSQQQQQQQQQAAHSSIKSTLTNNINSISNICDKDTQLSDDISQLLNEWHQPPSSSTTASLPSLNENTIQSHHNSMYMSGTQAHNPPYHQYNPENINEGTSHQGSFSNTNQKHQVWNPNPRYTNSLNNSLHFDTNEIIVSSQLGSDNASVVVPDHSNSALFHQPQLSNHNSQFASTDESSLWPPVPNPGKTIVV